MTTFSRTATPPTLLSEAEAIQAKTAHQMLAANACDGNPPELQLSKDSSEDTIKLPVSAVRLLIRILEELARGNAVAVIPVHPELTTREAAEILHISRPSLIQLLNEGQICYRRVGTHRRIQVESLIRYKQDAEAARLRLTEGLPNPVP
jgi:excisionase family DNA binding protein